jgi:hypothetical protein
MCEVKLFELRDRGTFIEIYMTKIRPVSLRERGLMRRAGWRVEDPLYTMTRLDLSETMMSEYQADVANSRTFGVAFKWIVNNWDMLTSGDLVCVEYILGERAEPKPTELF